MLSGPHALRWIALVALGALAVHRLRYAAGYGEGSSLVLERHGHGYMWMVLAASTLALCLAAAGVALALSRADRADGYVEAPAPSLSRLWARSTGTLVGLYVVQEWLEGMLAPAHPGGLAGVVGHGGWTAFAFAAAIGLVVALLVRGTGVALARVARRAKRARRGRALAPTLTPRRALLPRRGPLACRMAGRGPPLLWL